MGGQLPVFAEDGGICVDPQMQTSVACVLAAGDCCTLRQTHSLHWFQMRLWEQAAVMGAEASAALLHLQLYLIGTSRRCRCPHYANSRARTRRRH